MSEYIYKTAMWSPIKQETDTDDVIAISFKISDNQVDRDGDIVEQDWILDNWNLNPVVLWQHKRDIPPVARAEIRVEGNETYMTAYFSRANPLGKQLAYQALEGTLRAVSVSFISNMVEDIKDDRGRITGKRYMRNELLEASLVSIPANPRAVIQESVDMITLAKNVIKELKTMGISLIEKSVVPFQDLDVDMERAWDADAARARVARWAGGPDKEDIDWEKYRKAFLYFDAENPENFGSYKLPIADIVGGELTAIWRGIVAAMGALLGARGGVDMSEEDRRKVYNHLVKYYEKVDKEPPEFRNLNIQDILETIKELRIKIEALEERLNRRETKAEGLGLKIKE